LIHFRVAQTLDGAAGVDAAVAGRIVKVDEILIEVVDAFQLPAHADGPGDRRAADFEDLLHFVQQFDGFAAVAIQLVDEGKDRRIAQPANLHQLDGALFDAASAVDHHQRRIYGSQGTVGILGKILVAGRVEQVDDAVAVGKLHDRGRDRNAALLLQLHPVAGRVASGLAALDRASELDRTAEQQQLFGQGRLAGIGMGDDGEGAPPVEFVEEGGHREIELSRKRKIIRILPEVAGAGSRLRGAVNVGCSGKKWVRNKLVKLLRFRSGTWLGGRVGWRPIGRVPCSISRPDV